MGGLRQDAGSIDTSAQEAQDITGVAKDPRKEFLYQTKAKTSKLGMIGGDSCRAACSLLTRAPKISTPSTQSMPPTFMAASPRPLKSQMRLLRSPSRMR